MTPAGDNGRLGAFAFRRVGVAGVTCIVGSFVIFMSLYLAPGDPVTLLYGNRQATPEIRASIEAEYGLNDPLWTRYWQWLASALHGDFGNSVANNVPVSELISGRLATTALLVLLSLCIAVPVGIGLGRLASHRPGVVDAGVSAVLMIALATPTFVVAILLVSIFAINVGWFPAFGNGKGIVDRTWHLALPAVALSFAWMAIVAQSTRNAMNAESGRLHVQVALTRGLSGNYVRRNHIFRNAGVPITTAVGLAVGGLIAGTALVERAFGLSGLGSLLVDSVSAKDFPVAQAVLLLLLISYTVINVLVDITHLLIDPRIAVRGETG